MYLVKFNSNCISILINPSLHNMHVQYILYVDIYIYIYIITIPHIIMYNIVFIYCIFCKPRIYILVYLFM